MLGVGAFPRLAARIEHTRGVEHLVALVDDRVASHGAIPRGLAAEELGGADAIPPAAHVSTAPSKSRYPPVTYLDIDRRGKSPGPRIQYLLYGAGKQFTRINNYF